MLVNLPYMFTNILFTNITALLELHVGQTVSPTSFTNIGAVHSIYCTYTPYLKVSSNRIWKPQIFLLRIQNYPTEVYLINLIKRYNGYSCATNLFCKNRWALIIKRLFMQHNHFRRRESNQVIICCADIEERSSQFVYFRFQHIFLKKFFNVKIC